MSRLLAYLNEVEDCHNAVDRAVGETLVILAEAEKKGMPREAFDDAVVNLATRIRKATDDLMEGKK